MIPDHDVLYLTPDQISNITFRSIQVKVQGFRI